jgi:hypothetical protein
MALLCSSSLLISDEAPNGSRREWYYAQMNVLGIWIDCNFNPFVDTWNASDADFKEVEEWIQNRIKGNSPIQQEVVKTYD